MIKTGTRTMKNYNRIKSGIFTFKTSSMKNILSLFLIVFIPSFLFSQALSEQQIDSLVEKTMDNFQVPGMAVAVIKDGEIVVQKGYGIQSIKTNKPVNTKTLFGIASNTKAFTSAALAQLVDAGKIEWDTKVTEIIPEFKLYDPYVTSEFTIRDLLSHRSGLGLGAGDLMVFPAGIKTTLEEAIYNMRHLSPVSSFRSKFAYNNLFYVIAGEVVTRVSGMPYEKYIEKNFFQVLDMKRATMDEKKIEKDKNRIDGHTLVDGKLENTRKTFAKIGDPAAGIFASIEDMTKWVQARIDYGRYGKDMKDSLFTMASAEEMWSPQTIIKAHKGNYNTHFDASGLGWFLEDINGELQASHTGGLMGIVSQVIILPESKLGIIILTNQESGAAFMTISNTIKEAYLGMELQDYNKMYKERIDARTKKADELIEEVEKQLTANKGKTIELNEYISGTYTDPLIGEAVVEENNGVITISVTKSDDLKGTLHYYKGTAYAIKWEDPTLHANAFINFQLNTEGKPVGFELSPISPLTDFSYDYQDLNFRKD